MKLIGFVRASDGKRVYVQASACMILQPSTTKDGEFQLTIPGQTPIACVGDIRAAASRINQAMRPKIVPPDLKQLAELAGL